MSWKDAMFKAMSAFVSEQVGREVTVARYEDRTEYSGGCETCCFDWQVIDFFDESGTHVYTYDGSMSDFMEQLTR